MKTTIFFTTLSCLLLFAFAAHAQQQEQQIKELLQYMSSPRKQLDEEAQEIAGDRSPWNGNGTWMTLRAVIRLGGEAELGLTNEQKERLPFLYKENELGAEWYQKMRTNPTPEFIQAIEAVQAALLPDDPFFERATEEQKNAYREANMLSSNLLWEAIQKDVTDTLTPEQMLHVRKLEMQLMPALGIPFPSMFDPLDLTDEQKKEMNQIADELESEFDGLIWEAAMLKADRIVSVYKSLQGQTFSSQQEFNRVSSETHRKFEATEAMRKKRSDLQERGTKFMTHLQGCLMNVLTDEQLDKMQKIMDESPRFVKNVLTITKTQQRAQQANPAPNWVPGPDSWRPGDPVPAQFKEERRTRRFPKSE